MHAFDVNQVVSVARMQDQMTARERPRVGVSRYPENVDVVVMNREVQLDFGDDMQGIQGDLAPRGGADGITHGNAMSLDFLDRYRIISGRHVGDDLPDDGGAHGVGIEDVDCVVAVSPMEDHVAA